MSHVAITIFSLFSFSYNHPHVTVEHRAQWVLGLNVNVSEQTNSTPYQQVAFTISHFWLLYTYWGDQSLFSHFLLVSLLNFPFVLIIYHFVVAYVGALVYPLNFQIDCFSKQNFINLKTLVSFPKRNAWSSIFHLLVVISIDKGFVDVNLRMFKHLFLFDYLVPRNFPKWFLWYLHSPFVLYYQTRNAHWIKTPRIKNIRNMWNFAKKLYVISTDKYFPQAAVVFCKLHLAALSYIVHTSTLL